MLVIRTKNSRIFRTLFIIYAISVEREVFKYDLRGEREERITFPKDRA